MKNLVQRKIRSKAVEQTRGKGRLTRVANKSGPVPAAGPSAHQDDYNKATRVSDAKLPYRPVNVKLNNSVIIVNHLTYLIK